MSPSSPTNAAPTNAAPPPRTTPSPSTADSSDATGADWHRLETRLLDLVTEAYDQGWQPAELLRQARRQATRPAFALAMLAIAADHRSRPSSAYHPLWLEQIEGLDLPIDDATGGWLRRALDDPTPPSPSPVADGAVAGSPRGDASPGDRRGARAGADAIADAIADDAWSLFLAWATPPELPCLLPPPVGVRARLIVDLAGSTAPNPILDKVRALLAKAEATTFEAEAEAFTVKAHELMARHLIDDAVLAAGRRSTGRTTARPITIRLPIDAPYAAPKATLIAVVADAGGCRAVHHQSLGLTSVVGHAADVAAVELLFTSLLVQAQSAMHEQARLGEAHRRRGFRSAFLTAFAYRVGERLREGNDAVRRSVEEATGQSLVPVLAERTAAVQDAFDEIFTDVVTRRPPRRWDHRGAASGRNAANRAQLDTPAIPGAGGDTSPTGRRRLAGPKDNGSS